MNKKTKPAWPSATPPGIDCACTPAVFRAMKDALRAVDRDIERSGAASEETINKVRAARRWHVNKGVSSMSFIPGKAMAMVLLAGLFVLAYIWREELALIAQALP